MSAFKELALDTIDTSKKSNVVSTATPHTSNGLLRTAVAANNNAIGFISFGYIDVEMAKAVKIGGVDATVQNAYSKAWSYVRPLEVVTKGTPTGLAAKFINYLLSSAGQKILADENYMPLQK